MNGKDAINGKNFVTGNPIGAYFTGGHYRPSSLPPIDPSESRCTNTHSAASTGRYGLYL